MDNLDSSVGNKCTFDLVFDSVIIQSVDCKVISDDGTNIVIEGRFEDDDGSMDIVATIKVKKQPE